MPDPRREAEHFDARAAAVAAEVLARPIGLPEHERTFLAHEDFVRAALAALGDVAGKRVLDLGGGGGSAAVVLAGRGARVLVADVSRASLKLARQQATKFGVGDRVAAAAGDGLRLPLRDGSADRILGIGVLHHLGEPAAAGREVRRVLAPGGRAAFAEPLAGNPFLALARRSLPYRKKHRTEGERPMTRADVRAFLDAAGGGTAEGFQLLSMVRRLLRNTGRSRLSVRALEALDRALFALCPPLRRWARYVVISVT
ncbi:MAG: class I SAM-dependent methyltransferase [Planctomycetales bacterium]|nr:class I SAM-dependent methyltransferase [Planctomycetales bacterium]